MKVEDLSSKSITWYVENHDIRNEKGQRIGFEDRRFLFDPMEDLSRFQVYKKCGQIGMSVTMVLKTFWAAKYKGWNIIHTFPTETDSNEFVDTKTDEIIANNEEFHTITGSLQRKEIDGRYLYYKGTKSKTAMIMTSADVIVADEYDRSDIGVVNKMDSRMQASEYKGFWWLSNPTVDGAGVDDKWQKSDQKEWVIECSSGHEHVLTWPDSLEMDEGKYICKECGLELSDDDRRFGAWEPMGDPDAEISGYHISLMMAPWVSAKEIVRKWDDGKDPEGFFNFVVGEPYSPGDTKVSRTMILDNWTPNHQSVRTNNVYMGVDVGTIKHYVIGSEKGITQIGQFKNWKEFEELKRRYNPNVVVIDALPDTTWPDYYRTKYRNVFINYFSRDKQDNRLIRYGEKDKYGIIQSDKHRIIDRIVNDLLHGRILYGLPSDKSFQEYIKQSEVMRRMKVVDSNGIETYRWQALGEDKGDKQDDHYFLATVYWWIAKQAAANGAVFEEMAVQDKDFIKDTSKGFVVDDVDDFFEEEYAGDF